MGTVVIRIQGRPYELACEDGQEGHLETLGQELDRRVSELSRAVGQLGDARLLAMAGMLMADELMELKARAAEVPPPAPAPDPEPALASAPMPDMAAVDRLLAEGIHSLTRRLEAIAERLEKA